MSLLQVRDCPDDLYENLAGYARQENRSISQQTVYILKTVLGTSDAQKAKRNSALEAMAKNPIHLPESAKTPEELIREDRDR